MPRGRFARDLGIGQSPAQLPCTLEQNYGQAWWFSSPGARNVGDYTDLIVTCSETYSISAEMLSEGAADCEPKTDSSAIYDPRIVS